MTANKAVYKCPCCDYRTHFPKALEAHQKFSKHFKQIETPVETIVETPVETTVEVVEVKEEAPTEEVVVEKKTRKPRAKKTEAVKE